MLKCYTVIEVILLGRKRTSNKRNLNLWVDKDLIDQLNQLKILPSVFFTEKVEELMKEIEEKPKKDD